MKHWSTTSAKAKKSLSVFLCVCVLTPALAGFALPERSEAFGLPGVPQVVIESGPNLAVNSTTAGMSSALVGIQTSQMVKEYTLDSIMWVIVKVIISQIVNSTITWIQNGFEGNPAFVQNPESFFFNIGDAVAGDFILNNEHLSGLCSPFGMNIRAGVLLNYQRPFGDNVRCTLTDVVSNIDAFTNDLRTGDWIAWQTMTQEDQNNPYGAYFLVEDEMNRQIQAKKQVERMQLEWGQGFLTWKDENGNTQTPGSVINAQLNQQLGSGVRQLELADEMNEVISALVSQLVSQALGGLGGLRGSNGNGNIQNDMENQQNITPPPIIVPPPVTLPANSDSDFDESEDETEDTKNEMEEQILP